MAEYAIKYKNLIDLVYKKTMENKINWEDSWKNEIVGVVGQYTLILKETQNADGEPCELVEIRDGSNIEIDSFTDETFVGMQPPDGEFSSYFSMMSDLRKTARRQALGVDQAIDQIIRDLE